MDALSMTIGVLLVLPVCIGLFYLVAYLKNRDRYAIPKYLPRIDQLLWAQVLANPDRIWLLTKTTGLKCVSWDFGIFKYTPEVDRRYRTTPTLGDVIIAPKKWGGSHALVVTENLSPVGSEKRFSTTYLGEFVNEFTKSRSTIANNATV